MKVTARRLTLTSVSAALMVIFNTTLPFGLPPSINPLPLRIPSTVITMIVAIIDPWAGAVSSLIGNFTSDYFMVGLGAIPALVGPWCYLAFGHIMRKEGKTLRKLLLGSVICIVWITFTLTIGFWLLQVMPITTAFYLILTSITLTFILSDLVMIPILPRLYQFIRRRQKEN